MANNGDSKINTRDFLAFLERYSEVPEGDDDEPFILDYKTEDVKGKPNPQIFDEGRYDFSCVLTTKRLLKIAAEGDVFHADSTYKLNWMGFPVHIFGITDHHRAFHTIAIGFSTRETQEVFSFCFKAIKDGILELFETEIHFRAFMSDAAPALKKGFAEHFPNALQLMCWFHVKKSIKARPFKKNTHKEPFLNDITRLHLCPSVKSFDIAWKLFAKKWHSKETTVTNYIKKQWLSSYYKYWFAGAALLAPSTNNAVESTNRRIKDDFNFRTRSKMNVFQTKILQVLNVLSCEYRDDVKQVKRDVPISNNLWNEGIMWAKSTKKVEVTIEPECDRKCYFVPAGESRAIRKSDLNKYVTQNWTDFSEFVTNSSSIWKVQIPDNNVSASSCTCKCYLNVYVCKHIIGMRLRLQNLDIPDHIRKVEQNQSKRGRPAHARRALERD